MKMELARMIGFRRDREGKTNSIERIQEISVDSIVSNPYQARENFGEGSLLDLSQSILEHGVIQPIIVKPLENGFELVAGERRLMACKMAGLKSVPAVVRNLAPQEVAMVGLIENLQRKDLNAIEEATGYQRLIREFGLTQEELAKRIGKDQSTIANKLRLLKLPQLVIEGISQEIITERHARALLRLPSDDEQVKAFEIVRERALTVGETEKFVQERLAKIAGTTVEADLKSRTVVRVFKDIRLFLNSVRSIVKELKKAGLAVILEERNEDEWIEVMIRIPKRRDKDHDKIKAGSGGAG